MLFIHRYYLINGTIVLCLLLSLIAALVGYKKVRNPAFLTFVFYTGALLLTEAGSDLYSIITRRSNHFIYNTYLFFLIGFQYFIFGFALQGKLLKRINTWLSAAVLVFAACNILFIQGTDQFNSYSHYLLTYFSMLMSLLYFYELLRSEIVIYPLREYLFWFISGVFIANMLSVAYYFLFLEILDKDLDPDGLIYEYINLGSRLIQSGFSIFGFLSAAKWIRSNY